jgi:16S rRNA (guanine527-N7)-methyltransferase
MRNEFLAAIDKHQSAFGLDLPSVTIGLLADYYHLVLEHNPLLHLVGPCSPEEFATRHILESVTLLEHLPKNARFADVGAGAGLPSIPCLIARPDLTAELIESKEKKAKYLESAIAQLKLDKRAEVVNKQFEEVKLEDVSHVTCRALDKFVEKLPRLLKWSGKRKLLFFGGNSLGDALAKYGVKYEKRLMPLSEKRYLFIVK